MPEDSTRNTPLEYSKKGTRFQDDDFFLVIFTISEHTVQHNVHSFSSPISVLFPFLAAISLVPICVLFIRVFFRQKRY
jgi:hypothetical protein